MKKFMSNGKIRIMQDPSQGYSWNGTSKKIPSLELSFFLKENHRLLYRI